MRPASRDPSREAQWWPALVAERLEEAADVLSRLPEPRAPGLHSLWPIVPNAPAGDGACTQAAPSPEAIDRMDEVLGWRAWLVCHPKHLDSIVAVAGYAAVLRELVR